MASRPSAVLVALASCLAMMGCVFYMKPQCDDQIMNGSESDIDCGGSCRKCSVGRQCESGGDCESGICRGGSCAPLPCENGIRDGAETDVDCGGGTCRKCSGARHCLGSDDCAGGTCDLASSTCHSLRTVTFAEGVSYGAGYKTYALFSADLDGDGHVDLAAANEQDSSVTVLMNRGDGTFQRSPADVPTGQYPTGGAVADLNHDGIPDLVTADYHGNSVSVLIGSGGGTLTLAGEYPTEAGAATSNLAVGDLNGDGNPDVVATNPERGSISIFAGRADGTLQAAINVAVGILGRSAPFSVAVGDFDHDGRQDIAVADIVTRTIIVRRGNGDLTFGPEVAFPIGAEGPFIVIAHDMNLDGHLDLVVANRGGSSVSVLPGRGDGTFRDPIVSSTGPATGPYSVAVADFNLDGVPDLVTANFQSSTATVLLGIGDGRFEVPVNAGPTGNTSYGVATGDFDGDGRPDFAVCNAASNDVVVRMNASF